MDVIITINENVTILNFKKHVKLFFYSAMACDEEWKGWKGKVNITKSKNSNSKRREL